MKEAAPEIATAINFTARLADPLGAAAAARADILNMSAGFITEELCAQAHAAGLGTQCFMNDPGHAVALARMGLDFMDSDRPDVIRAAVRAAG